MTSATLIQQKETLSILSSFVSLQTHKRRGRENKQNRINVYAGLLSSAARQTLPGGASNAQRTVQISRSFALSDKRVCNRISQTWHLSRCACATKDKMSVRDKEGKQMLSLLKIRWFVGVQLTIVFIEMSMKNTHSEVQ